MGQEVPGHRPLGHDPAPLEVAVAALPVVAEQAHARAGRRPSSAGATPPERDVARHAHAPGGRRYGRRLDAHARRATHSPARAPLEREAPRPRRWAKTRSGGRTIGEERRRLACPLGRPGPPAATPRPPRPRRAVVARRKARRDLDSLMPASARPSYHARGAERAGRRVRSGTRARRWPAPTTARTRPGGSRSCTRGEQLLLDVAAAAGRRPAPTPACASGSRSRALRARAPPCSPMRDLQPEAEVAAPGRLARDRRSPGRRSSRSAMLLCVEVERRSRRGRSSAARVNSRSPSRLAPPETVSLTLARRPELEVEREGRGRVQVGRALRQGRARPRPGRAAPGRPTVTS